MYKHTILCKGDGEFVHLVHRLVLETFVGPCPEGLECRHLDGNELNNNLDNLAWGTKAEQIEDKKRHGTFDNSGQLPGEGHWNNKLTEQQAIEIRTRAKNGERPCRLCKEFDVSEATIRDIRDGKSWRHLL